MAFLGQDGEFHASDFVAEIQDKISKLSNVAQERDRIHAENEDKPAKIAIAAAVGLWAIYYFLIKR